MLSKPSRVSLYIKDDLKKKLKIKAATDEMSISKAARFFLKNWNLGVVGFVEYEDRKALPHKAGVYFIISDSRVRYIGQTVDLKTRLGGITHHKHDVFGALKNPTIFWLGVNVSELKNAENELIEFIDPDLNGKLDNNVAKIPASPNKTSTVRVFESDMVLFRALQIKLAVKWNNPNVTTAEVIHYLIVKEEEFLNQEK